MLTSSANSPAVSHFRSVLHDLVRDDVEHGRFGQLTSMCRQHVAKQLVVLPPPFPVGRHCLGFMCRVGV